MEPKVELHVKDIPIHIQTNRVVIIFQAPLWIKLSPHELYWQCWIQVLPCRVPPAVVWLDSRKWCDMTLCSMAVICWRLVFWCMTSTLVFASKGSRIGSLSRHGSAYSSFGELRGWLKRISGIRECSVRPWSASTRVTHFFLWYCLQLYECVLWVFLLYACKYNLFAAPD